MPISVCTNIQCLYIIYIQHSHQLSLSFMESSSVSENSGEAKSIRQFSDWWYQIPIYNSFLKMKDRAAQYDYIKQGNEQDIFYFRGSSVHPKLSEFPQCKDIIRDYYRCRDEPLRYQMMNICGPLKRQLSACVNLQFVKKKQKSRLKMMETRETEIEKVTRGKEREQEIKKQRIEDMQNKFLD